MSYEYQMVLLDVKVEAINQRRDKLLRGGISYDKLWLDFNLEKLYIEAEQIILKLKQITTYPHNFQK